MWDTVPKNIKNCKKYITEVGFIWFTSPFCNIYEEKKLYIFYKFWSFSYRFCICSLGRMGKFRLVYRWSFSFFFFFLRGMRRLCKFWAIHPRVWGNGAFNRDFLAGELGQKNFVFWTVVVTIYLFIYYYYHYYYYYYHFLLAVN